MNQRDMNFSNGTDEILINGTRFDEQTGETVWIDEAWLTANVKHATNPEEEEQYMLKYVAERELKMLNHWKSAFGRRVVKLTPQVVRLLCLVAEGNIQMTDDLHNEVNDLYAKIQDELYVNHGLSYALKCAETIQKLINYRCGKGFKLKKSDLKEEHQAFRALTKQILNYK